MVLPGCYRYKSRVHLVGVGASSTLVSRVVVATTSGDIFDRKWVYYLDLVLADRGLS